MTIYGFKDGHVIDPFSGKTITDDNEAAVVQATMGNLKKVEPTIKDKEEKD